jgi:hypothetical protein
MGVCYFGLTRGSKGGFGTSVTGGRRQGAGIKDADKIKINGCHPGLVSGSVDCEDPEINSG